MKGIRTVKDIERDLDKLVKGIAGPDIEAAIIGKRVSLCGTKEAVAKASAIIGKAYPHISTVTYEDDPDIELFTVAVFDLS